MELKSAPTVASLRVPTVLTMLDKNKEDNGSKLIGEKNPALSMEIGELHSCSQFLDIELY